MIGGHAAKGAYDSLDTAAKSSAVFERRCRGSRKVSDGMTLSATNADLRG